MAWQHLHVVHVLNGVKGRELESSRHGSARCLHSCKPNHRTLALLCCTHGVCVCVCVCAVCAVWGGGRDPTASKKAQCCIGDAQGQLETADPVSVVQQ
jgi:hypothetical protein